MGPCYGFAGTNGVISFLSHVDATITGSEFGPDLNTCPYPELQSMILQKNCDYFCETLQSKVTDGKYKFEYYLWKSTLFCVDEIQSFVDRMEETARKYGMVLECKGMNLFKQDEHSPSEGGIYQGKLYRTRRYRGIPYEMDDIEKARCAKFMNDLAENHPCMDDLYSSSERNNPENYGCMSGILAYHPVYDFDKGELLQCHTPCAACGGKGERPCFEFNELIKCQPCEGTGKIT